MTKRTIWRIETDDRCTNPAGSRLVDAYLSGHRADVHALTNHIQNCWACAIRVANNSQALKTKQRKNAHVIVLSEPKPSIHARPQHKKGERPTQGHVDNISGLN